MKTLRTFLKKHYFRKAVIYSLTYCMLFNSTMVFALNNIDLTSSTGMTSATFGTDTVLNTANGAILNWNNFNTSAGQSVTFNQPGSDAAVLNRISGAATQFDGSLFSNGNVFIVNPAGVYFGAGSVVNVNQLVASTLGISNEDFIAGNYEFIAGGSSTGGIINNGSITAAEGAALIGKYVQNNGTITTGQGGFVVMAAGDRVLLGQPGGNILLEMDSVTPVEAEDGEIVNSGSITSQSGTIVLAAGDIYSQIADISKVSTGTGTIKQNGTINANGTTAAGGTVDLTAADEVILGSGSLTSANAGTNADAGYVLVHSSENVTISKDARIEAKGGSTPDGDDTVKTSVEISGDQVVLAGNIDASATNSKRGKVVIDADNIIVKNGYTPDEPAANNIYEKWIESQSQAATDVELVAHSASNGNINVENISDGQITGGSGDIILHTKYDTGGITFDSENTSIRTTKGGSVYMLAGTGGITTGDITADISSGGTEPGKIMLLTNNGGDITTGKLRVSGGSYAEISAIASGSLTINDNVETMTNLLGCEKNNGHATTLLESINGNIMIDGLVRTKAYGKYSTTSEITMNAGHNIIVNSGENQIEAFAHTTTYYKPADASVSIHAGGTFTRDTGGDATVHAYAKSGVNCNVAEVFSTDSEDDWDETSGHAHASLEIEDNYTGNDPIYPEPPIEPPVPPVLPAGLDDENTTHMGVLVEGNVLENDDPDVTIESYTQPAHGTVNMDENGDYAYTPEPGYADNDTPDSFTYVVTDGELSSEPITIAITVSNALPQAGDDSAQTHMGIPVGDNVLVNDSDADGDLLTVVMDGVSPQHGTLVLNTDGTYTYTPTAGYVGTDTFAYTVTDGQLNGGVPVTVTGTATITIGNNPPVANNDNAGTNLNNPVVIDVLSNDTDVDKDAITPTLLTGDNDPLNGTITLNTDGSITYTPNTGYSGNDYFRYFISDGQTPAQYSMGTVFVTVYAAMAAASIPAAPLPENPDIEISGCPALSQWTAQEIGADQQALQIWMTNTLASSRDIQPCVACANLREAAIVLKDATYLDAVKRVVSGVAAGDAPLSEEQIASLRTSIAGSTEAKADLAYAKDYIETLQTYVKILDTNLEMSQADSFTVAVDNYIAPLAQENINLAVFLTAMLTSTGR